MVDESTKFGAGVEAVKPYASGSNQFANESVSNNSANDRDAQLEALKGEIASLKEAVASLASAARTAASASLDTMVEEAEVVLKRNVFVSVGIAAFIGYIWGRTR